MLADLFSGCEDEELVHAWVVECSHGSDGFVEGKRRRFAVSRLLPNFRDIVGDVADVFDTIQVKKRRGQLRNIRSVKPVACRRYSRSRKLRIVLAPTWRVIRNVPAWAATGAVEGREARRRRQSVACRSQSVVKRTSF